MELSSLSPLLRFFVIQEDKPSLTFLGRGNRLSRAACSAVSQAASLRLWFSGTKKVSGSSPPAWGRPLEERTVTGNASAEKVAIVTASGSGMGAACARELAQRGYAVALMSTSGKAEALAKELGGIGLTGSVTEEADLEALVGGTLERYGRVDAVINSTGHEALDLVVLNVVRIARLVTPAMLRLGAIVNVSTFSAFEPSPTFPLSSSLRAALAGFSKLYADRYAADGVSMNNVLPGYIESFEIDEETRGRYRCGGGARSKRSRRPWRSSCHPMPLT
jgi:NAD(P)-dependent dehydrogenase (short-subunit alcohol dehydrogenase family)